MYSCFSSTTFQTPRHIAKTCKVGKNCFKKMPFDRCLDELSGSSDTVKTAAPCLQEVTVDCRKPLQTSHLLRLLRNHGSTA